MDSQVEPGKFSDGARGVRDNEVLMTCLNYNAEVVSPYES
jgi:hypothetical protein